MSRTDPPGGLGAGSGLVEFAAMMSSMVGTPLGSMPSSTQLSTRGRWVGSASNKSENALSYSTPFDVFPPQTCANWALWLSRVHQDEPAPSLPRRGHREDEPVWSRQRRPTTEPEVMPSRFSLRAKAGPVVHLLGGQGPAPAQRPQPVTGSAATLHHQCRLWPVDTRILRWSAASCRGRRGRRCRCRATALQLSP